MLLQEANKVISSIQLFTKRGFQIRQGAPSDYATVEEIWRATGLLRSFDQSKTYQTLAKMKIHILLLAEVDQIVVGAANAFYGGWIGYIHHLGVHPDFQRLGIGSLLLNAVCRQLKTRKIQFATLLIPAISTRKQNYERQKFYKLHGFKRIRKLFLKKL
jgi:ribosomal protein S18 acetylase RimI-like enzyme